jgi:type I site-specific restriction endonuclease
MGYRSATCQEKKLRLRGTTVSCLALCGALHKADHLLFYKPNIPIAVVEAKDNNHAVGAAGMQQALEFLEVPLTMANSPQLEFSVEFTGRL